MAKAQPETAKAVATQVAKNQNLAPEALDIFHRREKRTFRRSFSGFRSLNKRVPRAFFALESARLPARERTNRLDNYA
jgi:hypothetical protein